MLRRLEPSQLDLVEITRPKDGHDLLAFHHRFDPLREVIKLDPVPQTAADAHVDRMRRSVERHDAEATRHERVAELRRHVPMLEA